MRKFTSYLLVCFTLLTLIPTKVKATHAAGAELLFEWVSDSTYRLYYKFYRDCQGTAQEPASVDVCYYNTCTTYYNTVTLNKISGLLPNGAQNGSDISSTCPTVFSTCASTGGTVPGYREWWYTGTVTLPSRCNSWVFAYGLSARNDAITNLVSPGSQSLYVEATLDNLDAQGDTSPFFSVRPVPYVCANQPYTYNNGAVDVNNDSMYFYLAQPRTGSCGNPPTAPTNIDFVTPSGVGNDTETYNIAYNPLESNWTFTLDHNTGQMSFTPDQTQRAVLSLIVNEYRGGQKIGSVMRDIQIVVLDCPNQQPDVQIVTNTVSGAFLDPSTGNITACANHTFTFNYTATSATSNAQLVTVDNSAQATPGATVTYAGQATNSVLGVYTWTPGPTDTGLKIFTVTVKDSTCNLSSNIIVSQTFVLPIYIVSETTALRDTAVCPGTVVPLQAIGGGDFTWDVLPGGSPASTLSCINCANPTVNPTVTTSYVVTANSNNGVCKNKDTVTVTIVPSITVSAGPDLITCYNNSIQLNATVSPSTATDYTLTWTDPMSTLSNINIANPVAGPLTGTAYTYVVTVSSNTGSCPSFDTVQVNVLPKPQLVNHDTAICQGQSIQANIIGNALYAYTWTPSTGVSMINSQSPTITPDTGFTKYVVYFAYPGCATDSSWFTVDAQITPTVNAGPDRIVCSGDTIQLNATVTPDNNYTYNWTPATNLTEPTHNNPVFNGTTSVELTVTASTTAGCTGQDKVDITVINTKFLHVSNDTTICPRDTAHLWVKGDSLMSFYWAPDLNISNITSDKPDVYPDAPTRYTVYGIDSTNCHDTASVYVSINPAAVISMPDSMIVYPGDSYHIEPATNCVNFAWFPPLGLSDDHISNPIAQPVVSTRYTVRASTEAGCAVIDSIDVIISNDSYIDVPNAFTPGTGSNNMFKPVHLGEATLDKFEVYNRWGIMVYSSKNINEGWNGEYNGQPQPAGVYIYLVEAHTYKGKKITKQGNVTMLR